LNREYRTKYVSSLQQLKSGLILRNFFQKNQENFKKIRENSRNFQENSRKFKKFSRKFEKIQEIFKKIRENQENLIKSRKSEKIQENE
jgi:hypothetical protein